MRRRATVRAATLLLALLLPVTSVRAAAPSCCVAGDDCDQPCCARADHPTVVPVLPCCRTISIDQQPADPPPSTVDGPPALALLTVAQGPIAGALLAARHTTSPPAHHLPAAPLYQRHCALLL